MQTVLVIVTIDSQGTTRFLDSEATAIFKTPESITRRASNVEPDRLGLRIIFHTLRYTFGEHGTLGEWTRHWSCAWRVNLAPVGGPILPQRWTERQSAIDAEIVWLNQNFI